MTTHQVFLAGALAGALSLGGGIVAQTAKSKSETVTIPVPPPINVNTSDQCVDLENVAGGPTNTVTWQIDPSVSGISNFHIIFAKKTPFARGERYFDKDHSTGTLKSLSNSVAEAFPYDIVVDGGKACDPHVIIIQGK
jgi:hypothetical protein